MKPGVSDPYQDRRDPILRNGRRWTVAVRGTSVVRHEKFETADAAWAFVHAARAAYVLAQIERTAA